MSAVCRLGLPLLICLGAACSTSSTTAPKRATPQRSSVIGTAQGSGAEPVASVNTFADLNLLRAWLAPTIAQSAHAPARVRTQIVHTTRRVFETAENPSNSDTTGTAVYGVQLTGTMFVCPCDTIDRFTGSALRLTWDPSIHYVSSIDAGPPVDLRRLGAVFDIDVGHPTQPAPDGPQCEQPRGRPTTITHVVYLSRTVLEDIEVFSPPGDVGPRVSAGDALQAVVGFSLAPKVTATLARMTAPSNSLVPATRLVWVLSARNVELSPNIGLPVCGSANAVVDATTNRELLESDQSVPFFATQ